MASGWKPMSALPDFMECPSHILVWNECNGTSEIAVEPEDIDKLRADKGWRLWRDVPTPSEKEVEAAMMRALKATRNQ